MARETDRRRFIGLAGAGTALSLAGCPGLQSDTDPDSEADASPTGSSAAQETPGTGTASTPDGSGSEAERVTVAVQPDQQQLRQRQQEIQSELQAGNITRNEAQQRAQAVEADLRRRAIASVQERARSAESLTITDTVDQFGVMLASGSATSLIGALDFADVSALLPEQTFQQARAQAQQSQSPTPSN